VPGKPPVVEALIPHRGSARLVERILEWHHDRIECVGRIPLDSAFLVDGVAPAFLGLELAAQAAAALEGLARPSDDAPQERLGYLVGIKDARFAVSHLPGDVELRTSAVLVASAPPLAIYAISVRHGDVECVSATMSTYAAPRERPRSL
jgi:predicted hotdog family 3-hydroxylacyl-ACP dehydratase